MRPYTSKSRISRKKFSVLRNGTTSNPRVPKRAMSEAGDGLVVLSKDGAAFPTGTYTPFFKDLKLLFTSL